MKIYLEGGDGDPTILLSKAPLTRTEDPVINASCDIARWTRPDGGGAAKQARYSAKGGCLLPRAD